MTAWHDQILVHPVAPIAALAGLKNGQLPDSVLIDVADGDGKHIGRVEHTVARAWTAMAAAAHAAGVNLSATDTYRTLVSQDNLWNTRYDHTNHGLGSRTCGGDTRYLKPHCATCACPGTSNHGWARAFDTRNETPATGLTWLEHNAQLFGFQWEVPSEVWHLQYFAGDQIPQAVLDFEHGNPTPAPPAAKDPDMAQIVTTPKGGDVPPAEQDQNYLIGLGAPLHITGPAAAGQLTSLLKHWGPAIPITDLEWDAIKGAYTQLVADVAAKVQAVLTATGPTPGGITDVEAYVTRVLDEVRHNTKESGFPPMPVT